MNLFDRSNCFTQGFLSPLHYATKNKNKIIPGNISTFSGFHYPYGYPISITEMDINFVLKILFRFSKPVFVFTLLKSVFDPVSAVIDQSIRDNFHHIFHAKTYHIIPGFAHARL